MQHQVHDYSPAIPASGLFWTMPIASESVQVDFDSAQAVMRVHGLDMPDWGNVKMATTNGPQVPRDVEALM